MVNEANRNRNSERDVKYFDREESVNQTLQNFWAHKVLRRQMKNKPAPVKAKFNFEKRDEVSPQRISYLISFRPNTFWHISLRRTTEQSEASHVGKTGVIYSRKTLHNETIYYSKVSPIARAVG